MALLSKDNQQARVEINAAQGIASCSGEWTRSGVVKLYDQKWPKLSTITIDGQKITIMDTVGAWLLYKLVEKLKSQKIQVELQGFSHDQSMLLSLVEQQASKVEARSETPKVNILMKIGQRTHLIGKRSLIFLDFLGEVCVSMFRWLRYPKNIQWRLIMHTVENTGYQALPLVAVLSLMVGVVLTYQMGLQLRTYGANIFIVNLLGMSILREFAPLMTAIMIAGRSGSAFTAQLGTMQINEEVDALRTMGIAPIDRLVLHKIFGLMIALPLLTVWSDIMGVLGGMIMSRQMLDISFEDFLTRFNDVIELKTYVIGLAKTPFFAMIIACVGCYQGFQVYGSANSVGEHTTRSVVQAIFLIIAADALFSILLSWYKI